MKKPQEKLKKGMVKIEVDKTPGLDINKVFTTQRLLITTPTLGVVRMEWANARYGQTIPTNWSNADFQQMLNPYLPIGYQIADAENLAAMHVINGGYEWMLTVEDDNVLPPGTFIKMNEYMIKADVPIVSGLYFTKSEPPEPILYRGHGTGYYADWKMGEKVWVNGMPFGCALIHSSILKALWDESPEYVVQGQVTRRVFNTPSSQYIDPISGRYVNETGTSDLAFYKRIMKDDIFRKAGWPEYSKKEFPFLVDTTLFVKHIDRISGTIYPRTLPQDFLLGKITYKEALKLLTK